ncbi:MAG TPA: N-acetylmuramoyl-L-alanine amidase [Chitinophaga sp.]
MIRRSLLMFAALALYMQLMAQSPGNGVGRYFDEAYRKYPNIPKGTLEAVAYSASRMNNLQAEKPGDHTNCMDMPQRYGIFGLVEDGKGYFKNNLLEVAKLSNITPAQFKKDVRLQILAVAKFLSQQAGAQRLAANAGVESFEPVLEKLSEIPNDGSGVNTYARSLYTYDIYEHLQQGFKTPSLELAPVKVQLEKVYPARTLRTLQSPGTQVDYDNDRVLSAEEVSLLSTDYGPAKWDQAHTNNWATRTGGQKPTNVTVHTAEGSYAGTISWFNNGTAKVSAHYVIRSSDGQVTQMVREKDRAYHVLNHNNYTIGIEHEGFVAASSWYTTKMYNSSAALVRDICSSWSIDPKKCFKGAASSGTNPQPVSVRIKGHQHYSGNTHTDPGKYWNWTKYYNLINPASLSPTTITFTVRSESTGFGVANATATVKGPDGETQTLQTDDKGQLILPAEKGKYSIAFDSKGYNKLETFFVGGEEKTINADVTLDPLVNTLAAATAEAELKAADGKARVQGYIRDGASNKPLAGATVSLGANTATTDRNGYFSLVYSGNVAAIKEDAAPAKVAVKISKEGYNSYTVNRFLEPGTYTMKVGLNKPGAAGLQDNARTLQQGQEVETIPHGLFDRKEAEALQRMQAEDAVEAREAMDANAPVTVQDMALAAITVPSTIRVGISCSCTSCSSVKVMSLEAYVQSGLDDEWISGWGAASLRAGAVAYRSYGAWYVQHSVKSNFDIASTTCNQAWQSDTYTRTKDAATYTKGKVLIKSGKIFRSEYSAENNNAGCGNGYSGTGTSSGWPCISDALCKGKAKNGHGRGMCQWGSSRWATDGKTYSWILNHYYNPGGVTTSAIAAARTTSAIDELKTPADKSIKANRLEVAPNPVTGNEVKVSYTVSVPSQAMLQLYDNFGRLVKQERVALQQGVNRLSLDVSTLKGGIYIVTVRAAGGSVESKKFVLIR